jgi:hypothetical protein
MGQLARFRFVNVSFIDVGASGKKLYPQLAKNEKKGETQNSKNQPQSELARGLTL